MPDVEGLTKRWHSREAQWQFVDPGTGRVVAYWKADELDQAGRIELLTNTLQSEWRGLYYRAELGELDALLTQQENRDEEAYLLPVDPNMPRTTIQFKKRSTSTGLTWSMLVLAQDSLLIRAPRAGTVATRLLARTGKTMSFLDYADGLGLVVGIGNDAVFDEVLPSEPPTVDVGLPWTRVRKDNRRVWVWIMIWRDVHRHEVDSPEVRGLSSFLSPDHLLRTRDGRIVYVSQQH